MQNEFLLACRLTEPALAQRMSNLRDGLFAAVLSVAESDKGFAFSFANTDELFAQVQQLVAFERQCCPFLTFELVIPPAPEPIILSMPGETEIRTFIRDTFVALTPGSIH